MLCVWKIFFRFQNLKTVCYELFCKFRAKQFFNCHNFGKSNLNKKTVLFCSRPKQTKSIFIVAFSSLVFQTIIVEIRCLLRAQVRIMFLGNAGKDTNDEEIKTIFINSEAFYVEVYTLLQDIQQTVYLIINNFLVSNEPHHW